MKARITVPVLSLALAGFLSNLNIASAAQLQASQSTGDQRPPVGWTFLESDTAKESSEIANKAINYLDDRDYNGLDEYASELRDSRASFATGHWKLGGFYCGFSPSNAAPDFVWETRLAALQDWIHAKPDSVTARVALAYTLVDYAWKARGGGWADTVTDDGWQLLHDRLLDAGTVLDGADKLKERCPVNGSVRMMIALGLGFDRKHFDEIFRQATNSAPYYYDAYFFHRAMYLLPRWYGQNGEWEADLGREADQIGGEKGDEVYAQVVWCIHDCVSSRNIFREYHLSWRRVDRGFAVVEKEYPDSLAAKNEHAYMAVLAGDRQSAVKCFDQMAGKVDLQTWRGEANFMRKYCWARFGK